MFCSYCTCQWDVKFWHVNKHWLGCKRKSIGWGDAEIQWAKNWFAKGVFWAIILFEDDVCPVQPIKPQSHYGVFLKNAGVQLKVHSPIYLVHIPHSLMVMQPQSIRGPPKMWLSHWYTGPSQQIQAVPYMSPPTWPVLMTLPSMGMGQIEWNT